MTKPILPRHVEVALETSFEKMFDYQPTLKEFPEVDVQHIFCVLQLVAPSIAAMPYVAAQWLVQSLKHGALDITTIRWLAETEYAIRRADPRYQALPISA